MNVSGKSGLSVLRERYAEDKVPKPLGKKRPYFSKMPFFNLKKAGKSDINAGSEAAFCSIFSNIYRRRQTMTGIVNDKTRKAADIKAEKRAAALRENLKKRKLQGRKDEGKRDEEPQDSE